MSWWVFSSRYWLASCICLHSNMYVCVWMSIFFTDGCSKNASNHISRGHTLHTAHRAHHSIAVDFQPRIQPQLSDNFMVLLVCYWTSNMRRRWASGFCFWQHNTKCKLFTVLERPESIKECWFRNFYRIPMIITVMHSIWNPSAVSLFLLGLFFFVSDSVACTFD